MTNLSPDLESMTVLDDLNFEREPERRLCGSATQELLPADHSCTKESNPSALTNFPVPLLADSRSVAESQSVTQGEAQESTTPFGGDTGNTMSDSCGEEFNLRHCNEQPKGDHLTKGREISCRAQYASGVQWASMTHAPLAELSPNESQKDLSGSSNVAGVVHLATQRSGIAESAMRPSPGASGAREPETFPITPQPTGKSERCTTSPEQAPAVGRAPRYFVIRVCSKCGVEYRQLPCDARDHGRKTHGLCPTHLEESKVEFQEFAKNFSLNTQQIHEPATVNH